MSITLINVNVKFREMGFHRGVGLETPGTKIYYKTLNY